MTAEQIEELFWEAMKEKAIYNKLSGISKDNVHNWIKKRTKPPTIGDMLNVLWQLEKIVVHPPIQLVGASTLIPGKTLDQPIDR